MMRRILPAIGMFAVILMGALASLGYTTNAQAATCGNASPPWGVTGSSSSDAGLVLTVNINGVPTSGVSVTLTSDAYSIWRAQGGSNTSNSNTSTFSSGSNYFAAATTCSSVGRIIYGYGTSTDQGNRYALDCHKVTASGSYTNTPETFHVDPGGNPSGHPYGSWSFPASFAVTNGSTKFVAINWTDSPAPVAKLQGYKVNSTGTAFSASSSPGNSIVTVSGVGTDSGNPFYFNGAAGNGPNIPGGSTHNISVPNVTGYTIKYKICDSATASCDVTDFSTGVVTSNTHSQTFTSGHTYNMRWIYFAGTANLSAHIRDQGGAVNPALSSMTTTISGKAAVTGADNTYNNAASGNHTFSYGNMPAGWTFLSATVTGSATSCAASGCTINAPIGSTIGVTFKFKPGNAPTGSFAANCTTLSGTAHDTDTPNQGVTVQIKEGGSLVATTTSSGSSPYAFSVPTPASINDGNAHTLDAYALDTSTNAPVLLPGSGTTVNCATTHHKIFAANYYNLLKAYIRDNEAFDFNILTYIFPDAGTKSSQHLWTSGIWDNVTGGNSDNAGNARLDAITSINNLAENGCYDGNFQGASCKQRVPLAYVPQNDGSGKPGSTTPNGNIWLSLRNNTVGGADPYRGGIASTDTTNVAGYSGVHLNADEVSNIHVATSGLSTTANYAPNQFGQAYQGQVTPTSLQADVRSTLNLPGGSQNTGYQGWDNVRDPNKPNSGYSATLTNPNIDFANPGGSPANFTVDFSNLTSQINSFVGRQYATGTAVSFLQDGHSTSAGRTYANQSEPLTLSGQVSTVADAQLKWDEYVDWTQVDDKGHWRQTSSGGVATGYELGAYTNPHYETTYYLYGGNSGTPPQNGTYYYYSCTNTATPPVTTYGQGSSVPAGCSSYYSYPTYDTRTSCTTTTGNTYAGNTTAYRNYSTPNNESQFGWVNTQATQGSIPKGQNGQTASSYFSYQAGTATPAWAITGNNAFWQDTNITSMQNAGSTTKPSHASRWIMNTSDPLYTNRMIYDGNASISFYDGYYAGGRATQCWWSAPGSGGNGPSEGSSNIYINGYYANSRYLYENSATPTTPYYGLYGNGATFDGRTDGTVDTGWVWVSNKERVRYENTWNDRNRDLGARAISDFGGSDGNDNLLYGLDKDGSGIYSTTALPSRGSSIIYNPTIQAADGDIYAGRNIDSYFAGSGLSSAFLFAGGSIQNFSSTNNLGGLTFPGYYPNPTKPDGTPSGNRTSIPGTTLDPIHSVFRDFDATFTPAALATNGSIPNILNGQFNLSQNPKRVYKVGGTGNLTLSPGTNFCNGAGSIYVPGDLTISGNITYCGFSGARTGLPSVGFIVGGRIVVQPNVTVMVGTYFAQSSFNSGTVVTTGNRVSSDQPLAVLGLVVANSFNLQRQLGSSSFNQAGGSTPSQNTPEQFKYDGRIVVSPPPAFSDLYNASASWNESVPYN
jgi:hypothetical protein